MTIDIYKNTATKDVKSKLNAVYAFGRDSDLHGKDILEGGYAVFVLRNRLIGPAGELHRTWELVAKDLDYTDAIKLLNKRVHHKAYKV